MWEYPRTFIMKRHLLFFAVILGLSVLCSCSKEYDPAPEFISGDTICLRVDGNVIHTYNSNSWQAAYRTGSNQYRIFSDDNKDYYKVICSQKPEREGQEITASITWKAGTSTAVQKKDNVKFRVQRINATTGALWLWSSKSNIGVAIIQTE